MEEASAQAGNPMFDSVEKLEEMEVRAEEPQVESAQLEAPKTTARSSRGARALGALLGVGLVAAAVAAVVLLAPGTPQKRTVKTVQDAEVTVSAADAVTSNGEVVCFSDVEDLHFSWQSVAGTSVSFISADAGGLALTAASESSPLKVSLFGANNALLEEINVDENGINEVDSAKITEIIKSEAGQCLVQLAMGLGEQGYTAKDVKALTPLLQLAKVFYQAAKRTEMVEWDFGRLDAKRARANAVAKMGVSDAKVLLKPKGEVIIDVEAARRLEEAQKGRDLMACSTSAWFRLGDGRCDSAFNNAACAFDNGDCCTRTCKNYGALWGGSSPADGDGVTHPVYSCNVNDALTCVTSCPVLPQYWSYLGDGYCDPDLNRADCGFDLGDCCEVTCTDRDYSCGSNGYNCISGLHGMCQRSYCGNNDFGMCGSGSDCWQWLCGDCYCHYDCQAHDKCCSCDGTFTLCCINVFVVGCD